MQAFIWIWFALTALSVAYIAFDLFTRTPEMRVMKWGWLLVALYTGPVALAIYWFSCREPAPGTHKQFIAPLWKQSVGSTIHCLAGDATGVIVAASVTAVLGLPMGMDSAVEYASGFLVGLFVFQALFAKGMLGGGYWNAVRKTVLAEWVSMNMVMAGMIPAMVVWMSRDMRAMEPGGSRFWFVMSMATLVGAITGYPINVWLVRNKLKHGMGKERVLGRGGSPIEGAEMPMANAAVNARADGESGMAQMPGRESAGGEMGGPSDVPAGRKLLVALLTLAALAVGVALAGRYGNLAMRRGDPMSSMPQMPPMQMGPQLKANVEP